MNLGALYGQLDKNVFNGFLPGGAARPGRETPRMAGERPKAAGLSAPPTSGRGAGRTTFQQPDTRTPLERAPIGQVMTLGGVQGFKNANGEWQAGNPDAAAVEAAPQGMIPIPTFGTGGYAAAGYLKSLAGPLGRPFKILKNDDQVAFEDRTKEVGRQDDGTVVFNRNTAQAAGMEDEYDALGTDMGNKVLGRYTTKTGVDGSDIATDEYDTNRSVGYHFGKIFGGDSSASERISSAIALPHRALDNAGWTNPSPYGTQQIVGTPGTASPQAELQSPQPVGNTPSTYTVQSGDTLTGISNKTGISMQDLMRKNAIQDANIISIGQQLKY